MKKNLVMNEEREVFILMIGLFSILTIIIYVFSLIFWFLIISIIWLLFVIILHLFYYSRIAVDECYLTIKTVNKTYNIPIVDILYLTCVKNSNYVSNVKYYITTKNNIIIPKRFLIIKNKEFNKMMEKHILNVSIINKVIF